MSNDSAFPGVNEHKKRLNRYRLAVNAVIKLPIHRNLKYFYESEIGNTVRALIMAAKTFKSKIIQIIEI